MLLISKTTETSISFYTADDCSRKKLKNGCTSFQSNCSHVMWLWLLTTKVSFCDSPYLKLCKNCRQNLNLMFLIWSPITILCEYYYRCKVVIFLIVNLSFQKKLVLRYQKTYVLAKTNRISECMFFWVVDIKRELILWWLSATLSYVWMSAECSEMYF